MCAVRMWCEEQALWVERFASWDGLSLSFSVKQSAVFRAAHEAGSRKLLQPTSTKGDDSMHEAVEGPPREQGLV